MFVVGVVRGNGSLFFFSRREEPEGAWEDEDNMEFWSKNELYMMMDIK